MKYIILALALSLASPAFSDEHSWKGYLSSDPASFEAAISGAATCARENFAPALPQVSLEMTYTKQFHRPLKWTEAFVMADQTGPAPQIGFPFITVSVCSVGEDAVIKAYAMDDAIFRVEIAYAECDRAACIRHDWGPNPYDTAFLEAYDAGLLENISREQVREFLDFYDDPDLEPIAKALNCTASWAWVGRSEYDRYRCLVSGSVDGEIWTGAGAVEFFSPGLFGETTHGRYATYLEFIDVSLQSTATNAINRRISEVITPMQKALKDRLAGEVTKNNEQLDLLTTIQ